MTEQKMMVGARLSAPTRRWLMLKAISQKVTLSSYIGLCVAYAMHHEPDFNKWIKGRSE